MGSSNLGFAGDGDGVSSPSMRRELSVEDLFAPLNRLDMKHPFLNKKTVLASPSVGMPIHDRLRASEDFATTSLPDLNAGPSKVLDPVAPASVDRPPSSSGRKGSSRSKSPASGSDTGLHTQGNSTSDEDQQVIDDRKQRRMLSNRESARRSRLRKQQHLDELRAHVAQLRAQNSQMLNNLNLASQHFAQLSEENRMLRSEAMDLSHQLQRLHHTLVGQRANGVRFGTDSGQGAQAPLCQELRPLPPLS